MADTSIAIPQAHIDILLANPALAAKFDEKYGAGAAAAVMAQVAGQQTQPETQQAPAEAPDVAQEAPVLAQDAPVQPTDTNEEGPGVIGTLLDVDKGIIRGALGAVDSVTDLGADIADSTEGLVNDIGIPTRVSWDENGLYLQTAEEHAQWAAEVGYQIDPESLAYGRTDLRSTLSETETMAGGVAEGISQFATAFVLTRGAAPTGFIKGTGTLATVGRGAVQGAVADFVGFEEHEARLSDFLRSTVGLEDPITEYLQSDPSDHWAEGRLKNAIEGLIVGAPLDYLLTSLRSLRAAGNAKATGGTAAADAVLAQSADDLAARAEAALREAQDALRASGDEGRVAIGAVDDSMSPEDVMRILGEQDRAVDPDGRVLIGPDVKAGKIADEAAATVEDHTEWLRGVNGTQVPLPKDDDMVTRIAQAVADGEDDLHNLADAFNIEKIETPDEALTAWEHVLRRVREADPDLWSRTRSLIESKDKADQLLRATDPVTLRRLGVDTAEATQDLEVKLLALRIRDATTAGQLPELAVKWERLVKQGRLAEAADVATAFDRAVATFEVDTTVTKTIQKNAARTTSVGRVVAEAAGDPDAFGRLDAVQRMVADPQVTRAQLMRDLARVGKADAKTVRRLLNAAQRPDWWAIHNEIWINGLLAGIKTHGVNTLSNTVEMLMLPAEKMLAAGLRLDRAGIRDAVSLYTGLWNQARGSLRMGTLSLWNEINYLDPEHLTNELAGQHAIHMAGNSLTARGVNLAGRVVRMPTRLLSASDEAFKQLNYRSYRYARGMRQALDRGLRGRKAVEFANRYVDDGFDPRTLQATDEAALHHARRATFTDDLEYGLGAGLQNLVNRLPYLRLVMPFVRTPTNILRNLMRRTPGLNLFVRDSGLRAFIDGSTVARSEIAARLLLGSGVIASAAMLADAGLITGGRDPDYRKAGLEASAGVPRYSIRIGDKWVSFDRLDPRFLPFAMIADAVNAVKRLKLSTGQEAGIGDWMGALAMGFTSSMFSRTYLTGLAEFVEVLQSQDENAWGRFLKRRIGSYVPSLVAGLNGDTFVRELHGAFDGFIARLPWASQSLDARRNILGEAATRLNGPMGFWENLSPITVTDGPSDPLMQELIAVDHGFTPLPTTHRGTGIDITAYTLPSGQSAYDRWGEIISQGPGGNVSLRAHLEATIADPRYQALPIVPEDGALRSARAEIISQGISRYRQAAWAQLLQEFPALAQDVRNAKINAERVPLGAEPLPVSGGN